MIRFLLILPLIIFYLDSLSQESNQKVDSLILAVDKISISDMKFLSDSGCVRAGEIAEKDLGKNELKILIYGGISPVVYVGQEKFEIKYDVKYYDFGDTGPLYECSKNYNFFTFHYLDSLYGKKWRKEIRKDVVGLKEWKKK